LTLRRLSLSAVLACLLLNLGAQAPQTVLAARPSPAPSSEYQPGYLLVGYRADVDEGQKANNQARHGATLDRRLAAINVDLVRLPAGKDVLQAARDFKQDGEVAFAEPNFKRHADALKVPTDSLYLQQYGPQKMQALDAQNVAYSGVYPTYSGGNPTTLSHPLIAVIDTGIAARSGDPNAAPDLVRKTYNVAADCTTTSTVVTQSCPTSTLFDNYGHGTHVAGIAAAETDNGIGVLGIAPGAQLVSIKVLDDTGFGYDSWVASGILCAANLATCGLGVGHVDVINMSLGGTPGAATVQSAVATAQNAGVVVVASAGNSNVTALSYPAAYSDLSVIATDSTDARASFSNYGGYANNVSAPGVDILSTVSKDSLLPIYDPSGYALLSGTSMAAPHVAGLAGLLSGMGQNRATIIDRIKKTVDPRPNATSPNYGQFGYGRVNALKAVKSLNTYSAVTTNPAGTENSTPLSATLASPQPADFAITSPSSVPAATVSTPQGNPLSLVTSGAGGFNSPSANTFEYSALDSTGARTAALNLSSSAGAVPGTWNVVVSQDSPVGNYTVTTWVIAGGLAHAVTFTLTVTSSFAISAAPSSQSVALGATASYTVTITRSGGFTGAVTFAVSGLPAGSTGTFSPNPTTSNSSMLQVVTTSTTTPGTYTLNISGTSGSLVRTTSVQIVVAPLTVTGVQASNINASSAVITWQTSNPSNSRVDVGITTSYGTVVTDAANVTNHSITLSGLANNTTYHLKATSTDIYGQTTGSADSTFTTSTNLIVNGGFEAGSAGWNLVAQTTIDTNPANAHSGNISLKLVATTPWQGAAQAVAVAAGQSYSFTGWGRSTTAGGEFALISYNSSWAEVGPHIHIAFPGSANWEGAAAKYVAPVNTAWVSVIPANSSAVGTFWFDDISLSPSTNLIVNGGFEAGSAGWNLVAQTTIDTNPANAHSGNSSMKLVATTPWQGAAQSVAVAAGQSYSFTGWGRSTTAGGEFALISYNSSWAEVGPHIHIAFPGSANWEGAAANYVAPVNAAWVLVIPANSSASGTFWFDDVSLTKS
jgi:thermitase